MHHCNVINHDHNSHIYSFLLTWGQYLFSQLHSVQNFLQILKKLYVKIVQYVNTVITSSIHSDFPDQIKRKTNILMFKHRKGQRKYNSKINH